MQLGILGREALVGRESAGVTDPQNQSRYFSKTQHRLSGEFRAYWERRGGLPIFGYPISEPTEENGLIDVLPCAVITPLSIL